MAKPADGTGRGGRRKPARQFELARQLLLQLTKPTRRTILVELSHNASNVSSLATRLGIAASTIRGNLQALHTHMLVESYRIGRRTYYRTSKNVTVKERAGRTYIKLRTSRGDSVEFELLIHKF